MKKIILLIWFIINSMLTQAQFNNFAFIQSNISPPNYNVYYVDNTATGSGSGSNWTNAATAVSALNWASIKGGDIVYISGGSDSLTYVHDSVYAKYITGGIVTITNGKDADHNGKVIYLADKTYASGFAFGILNSQNIKVTGVQTCALPIW